MDWKWKTGSILDSYNEYTPCKDIFKAVCDEIAEYYIPKGWKYATSRPKLTFNDKSVKIEIAFWSSGSNMPGGYVNLEIIPAIYSLELEKEFKNNGKDSNACIIGYPTIFSQRLESIPKGIKRVINMHGEVKDFDEEYEETSVLRHHNNINVYGITQDDFCKIIEFLNEKILIWKDLIYDYDKLKLKISSFLKSDIKKLQKGSFSEYIKLKFPDKVEDFNMIDK